MNWSGAFISKEPAFSPLCFSREVRGDIHVYAKSGNVSKQYSFKLNDSNWEYGDLSDGGRAKQSGKRHSFRIWSECWPVSLGPARGSVYGSRFLQCVRARLPSEGRRACVSNSELKMPEPTETKQHAGPRLTVRHLAISEESAVCRTVSPSRLTGNPKYRAGLGGPRW
jgi:hypothetical protein